MSKHKLVTLALLLLSAQLAFGQRSLEFRFTPKLSQKPDIENPSPAKITAPVQIAYDLGVTYTHMLNQKWGIGAGITLGSTVYRWISAHRVPLSARNRTRVK